MNGRARYLLNSAIMTTPGIYDWRLLPPEEWRRAVLLAWPAGVASFVGYPETARVLGDFLGVEVPVRREVLPELRAGDRLYVARLRTRISAEAKGRRLGLAIADYELGVVDVVTTRREGDAA